MLEGQLVDIIEQPFLCFSESKKALPGLIKLGKGPLAHQLLLKFSISPTLDLSVRIKI